MASYGNFTFPNGTGQAVNDLHLTFPTGAANVNVLGVDGVGPDAPNAGYNLEGDGTGSISISGYNVPIAGSVTVRIKNPGTTLPTPITAQWTLNGKNVKNAFQVAGLAPSGEGSEPASTGEPVDFQKAFIAATQALDTLKRLSSEGM